MKNRRVMSTITQNHKKVHEKRTSILFFLLLQVLLNLEVSEVRAQSQNPSDSTEVELTATVGMWLSVITNPIGTTNIIEGARCSLQVKANSAAPNTITVNVSITGGTATINSDYTTSGSSTLVIPKGQMYSPYFVINTKEDTNNTEGDETIFVKTTPTPGSNAQFAGETMTYVIKDKVPPPPATTSVEFVQSATSVKEGGKVQLSAKIKPGSLPVNKDIKLTLAATSGSADVGFDYTLPTTITIPANKTQSNFVDFVAIADTRDTEGTERANFSISVDGGNTLNKSSSWVDIENVAPPGEKILLITPTSVTEGVDNVNDEIYAETESKRNATQDIEVTLVPITTGGKATPDADYTYPTKIVIPKGRYQSVSKAAYVRAKADALFENTPNEIAQFSLSVNGTNTIASTSNQITINDVAPKIEVELITPTSVTEGMNLDQDEVYAQLVRGQEVTNRDIEIKISSLSGASAGTDYACPTTVTIPAGSMQSKSKNSFFRGLLDLVYEGTEIAKMNVTADGYILKSSATPSINIVDKTVVPIKLTASSNPILEGGQTSINAEVNGSGYSLAKEITVNLSYGRGAGDAWNPEDYTTSLRTLTIPAGSLISNPSSSLTAVLDNISEGAELAKLSGSAPIHPVTGVNVTINNVNNLPSLEFVRSAVDVNEGEVIGVGDPKRVQIMVTGTVTVPTEVTISSTGAPAIGFDYSGATSIDIPVGTYSNSIFDLNMLPIDDRIPENTETEILTINANPSQYTIANVDGGTGAVNVCNYTINDNDVNPSGGVDIVIRQDSSSVHEGNKVKFWAELVNQNLLIPNDIVVTLAKAVSNNVNYGTDCKELTTYTLTIKKDETKSNETVFETLADNVVEGVEKVNFSASTVNPNVVFPNTFAVDIIDATESSRTINLHFDKDFVMEGDSFYVYAQIDGTAVTDNDIPITIKPFKGTAMKSGKSADYQRSADLVTIAAGSLVSDTLKVVSLKDQLFERDETVISGNNARETAGQFTIEPFKDTVIIKEEKTSVEAYFTMEKDSVREGENSKINMSLESGVIAGYDMSFALIRDSESIAKDTFDYEFSSGNILTIKSGTSSSEQSQINWINTKKDDINDEPTELLILNASLSDSPLVNIVKPSDSLYIINNSGVALRMDQMELYEGEQTILYAHVPTPYPTESFVQIDPSGVFTANAADYTLSFNKLTIPANASYSDTIYFDALNDALYEPRENLILQGVLLNSDGTENTSDPLTGAHKEIYIANKDTTDGGSRDSTQFYLRVDRDSVFEGKKIKVWVELQGDQRVQDLTTVSLHTEGVNPNPAQINEDYDLPSDLQIPQGKSISDTVYLSAKVDNLFEGAQQLSLSATVDGDANTHVNNEPLLTILDVDPSTEDSIVITVTVDKDTFIEGEETRVHAQLPLGMVAEKNMDIYLSKISGTAQSVTELNPDIEMLDSVITIYKGDNEGFERVVARVDDYFEVVEYISFEAVYNEDSRVKTIVSPDTVFIKDLDFETDSMLVLQTLPGELEEGEQLGVYVTLQQAAGQDIDIYLERTTEGDAIENVDYTVGNMLHIPAGATSSDTLPFYALTDSIIEHAEHAIFNATSKEIFSPVLEGRMDVLIYDRTFMDGVHVYFSKDTVNEGENVYLVAALNGVTVDHDLVVNLVNRDLLSTASQEDFISTLPTSITIRGGSMSDSILFETNKDLVFEGYEHLSLTASVAGGEYEVVKPLLKLTLVDVDANIGGGVDLEFEIDSTQMNEGSSAQGVVRIVNGSVAGKPIALRGNWSGDQISDTDVNLSPTFTLIIEAGKNSVPIDIVSQVDSVVEGDEWLRMEMIPVNDLNQMVEGKAVDSVLILDVDDREDLNGGSFLGFYIDSTHVHEGNTMQVYAYLKDDKRASAEISVNVNFNEASGTASSTDFDLSNTIISIAPGANSGYITVYSKTDELVEGNEQLVLSATPLNPKDSINASESIDSVVIVDMDDTDGGEVDPIDPDAGGGALLSFYISQDMIDEGGEGADLVVELNNRKNTQDPITVSLFVSDSLSSFTLDDKDHTPVGEITIPAGSSSMSMPFSALSDDLVEGFETAVIIAICNNEKDSISIDSYKDSVVIKDADANEFGGVDLTLSVVPNNTISEDSEDSLAVVVSLVDASTRVENAMGFTLNYPLSIDGVNMLAAADYNLGAGAVKTMEIKAGMNSDTLWFVPVNDELLEGEEWMGIKVQDTSAINTWWQDSVSVTIADDDYYGGKILITLRLDQEWIKEGDSSLLTASIEGGLTYTEDLVVDLSRHSSSSSKMSASDYNLPASITISANQSSASVHVVANKDGIYEGFDTLNIQGELIHDMFTVVPEHPLPLVIIDIDDKDGGGVDPTDPKAGGALLGFYIDSTHVHEGSMARVYAYIKNAKSTEDALSVNVSLSSGSLADAEDYTLSAAGIITIPAGGDTSYVDLSALADSTVEGNEWLRLVATAVNPKDSINASEAIDSVVIVDIDDTDGGEIDPIDPIDPDKGGGGGALLSFHIVDDTINEDGGVAQLIVSLNDDKTTQNEIKVTLLVADSLSSGSLTNLDYTVSGEVTILAGSNSITTPFSALSDELIEGFETAVIIATSNNTKDSIWIDSYKDSVVIKDADANEFGGAELTLSVVPSNTIAEESMDSLAVVVSLVDATKTVETAMGFTLNYPLNIDGVNVLEPEDYRLGTAMKIKADMNSDTLWFVPVNDVLLEGIETMGIKVQDSSAINTWVNDSVAVTITDDDYDGTAMAITLSLDKDSIKEGETAILTATIEGGLTYTDDLLIDLSQHISSSSKLNATDYDMPATLTILASTNSASVTVAALTDSVYEGFDTLNIDGSVSNTMFTVLPADTLPLIIIDIDDKDGGEVDPTDPNSGGALLGFYIDSTHVHEGSAARVYAYIKNAKYTEDALSVSVSLSSGSLADASDYTLSDAGIITIPEGGDTSYVDLSALADSTVEGNEWLRLVATAVHPKDSINASEAIDSVVIVDIDDTDGGEIDPIDPIDPDKGGGGGALLSFHIVEDTIQEDGGVAQLIVALYDDKTTQNEIKVTLLVADSLSSTSLKPSDYSVVTTITIAAGAKEERTTFTGITDNLIEGFETAVIIATSNNTKDSIWIDSYKDSVVIKDADANEFGGAELTLSVVPSNTIAEDSNDSLAVVVSLVDATKTVETAMGFTLNYPLNIDGVNLLEPEDYRLGTAMKIKATMNSDTLWFVPVNDVLLEGIEAMGIKVADSSAINTWVNDSVSVTITDDDYDGTAMAITLSLGQDSVKEGESALLTATIEGGLTYTEDLVVDLSQHISSSSKLNATDYDMPATLTILASTNSASVNVAALTDSVYEGFDTLNIDGSVSNTMFTVLPVDTLPLVIIDIDDKDGGEVDPTDPKAGGALLGFYIDSTHVHEGSMARVYAYIKNAKSTEEPLSVNVSLSSGSLADASDYTLSAAGIITIPEGGDTSYVDLSALADSTVEGNEWLRLVATAVHPKDSINASEAIDSVVIVDIDDTDGGEIDPIDPIDPDKGGGGGALLSFHIVEDTIQEDGGVAQLIVALYDDKTTQNEIKVTLLVADTLSSASLKPSDYTTEGTTITIPAGGKAGSTTFTAKTDNFIEGFETAVIIITKVHNKDSISIDSYKDSVVIKDADANEFGGAELTLSVVPSNTIAEDSNDSLAVVVSLVDATKTVETAMGFTLNYPLNIDGVNLLEPEDYRLGRAMEIKADMNSDTLWFVPVNDELLEGIETMGIKVADSSAINTWVNDSVSVTITDDDYDGTAMAITLSLNQDSVKEGESAILTATIAEGKTYTEDLVVDLSQHSSSSSKLNATDYDMPATITILTHTNSASVNVAALTDSVYEGFDTLNIDGSVSNTMFTVVPADTLPLIIIDIDDKDGGEVDPTDPKAGGALLGFYIDSTHVHEGSMARVYAYIKNAKYTEDALSVNVSLSSGSLADASDYTLSAAGIITIPEGGDTSYVDLSALADSTVEGNEWLRLVATAVHPKDSINASEAIDSVVIVDIDDTDGGEIDPIDPIDPDKGGGGGALLSFRIAPDTINEDGGVAQLIVSLNDDKTTQNEITVTLLVADTLSSASLKPSDYTTEGTTITIPARGKSGSTTFTAKTDNFLEGFETAGILIVKEGPKDSISIDSYKDSVVIKDADANEFGGAELTLSVVPSNTIAEESMDSLAVVVSLVDATKTVETAMGFTLNYPLNIDGVNVLEPEDYRLGRAMEIKADMNSDTLWFVPVNDELLEGIEAMGIKVQDSSAINTWVNDSVSVTITDDDYDGTAMAITLSLGQDSVKEGESAILTAIIEGGKTYTDDLVVDLSQHISSSSKLNATDYDMPATITILTHTNSASVTVAALKDSVYEGFDTLNIDGSVSNTMFTVLPVDTLPLVIIDIDDKDGGEVDPTDPKAGGALLGFYIDSTHVHEGSMARVYAYIKNAKYTEDALSVNVSLSSGSLADASDYTLSAAGIITIPEGGDTSYVDLSALADSTVEGNEWLRLVATAVHPKDSINASEAIDSVVIVDIDDTDGGEIDPIDPIDPDKGGGGGALLSFRIAPDTINEDGGVAQLIVSLNDDKTTQNEITVTLLVADTLSSASLKPSDYTTEGTTITIPARGKSGSTTFTAKTDNFLEGFETAGILIVKEGPKDSISIDSYKDSVVIKDADANEFGGAELTLSVVPSNTIAEESMDSLAVVVSLVDATKTVETAMGFTLNYPLNIDGVNVLEPEDYRLGRAMEIKADMNSDTLWFVPVNDELLEGIEAMGIKVQDSSAINTWVNDSVSVTITDDDYDGTAMAITLSLGQDSVKEGESAILTAIIEGGKTYTDDLVVDLSQHISSSSKLNATDYDMPATITILTHTNSASVTVAALKDSVYEGFDTLNIDGSVSNTMFTVLPVDTLPLVIIDIDDKDGGEVDPTDPKAGGALLGFYIDSTHVHEGSMARVYAYIKNAKYTEDALSVNVSLASGSLADASDYTLSDAGTITIPEGGDTSYVDLSALADSTVEGNEWLRLVATAVNPKDSINASEAIDSVVIVDIDDTDGGEIDPIDPIDPDKGGGGGALLSFRIAPDTINEDGGVAQLIVSLNDDKTTQHEITVTLLVDSLLSTGSLTSSDYTVDTTITIPAGAKEGRTTFTAQTDDLVEGFETAGILIVKDDPKDSISIDSYKDYVVIKDADANEFGGAELTLSVVPSNTIAENSNDSLAVVVSLADATKTVETDMGFTLNYPLIIDGVNLLEPEDYRLGTAMKIKARTNSDTLWFVPVNDELLEGIETMGIQVQDSSAINTWVNDSVSVTITDDDYDGTAMAITLSLDQDSIKEGESAILTATIAGGLTYTDSLVINLSQHISSSSKLNATDYTMPETITILAYTNNANVTVAALKDSVYEGFDTLNIKGSVSNTMFTVVPADTLPLIIIDIDDKDGGEVDPTDPKAGGALLGFYIDSTHVHEGSMARVYAYIKNAKYTEDALSVNVSLSFGSLADTSDYTLSDAGIITIPEGGDTSYVDLSALADSTVEGNEWLRLVATVVNPKDSINVPEATDSLVIVDIDDTDGGEIDPIDPIDPDKGGGGGALLSFHIVEDTIQEDGGVAQLIVSLNDDKTTQNEITVTLLVADSLSSASLKPSDYSVVTTITIPAGAKEQNATFTGITDNLIEGFETAVIIATSNNTKDSIWIDSYKDSVVIKDADANEFGGAELTLSVVPSNTIAEDSNDSLAVVVSLVDATKTVETAMGFTLNYPLNIDGVNLLEPEDYRLGRAMEIKADMNSDTLWFVPVNDELLEGIETMGIKVADSSAINTWVNDSVSVTITDDDYDGTAMAITLSLGQDSVKEGESAILTATIEGGLTYTDSLVINLSQHSSSSSKLNATDYDMPATITILTHTNSASVTVAALKDSVYEGFDTLNIKGSVSNTMFTVLPVDTLPLVIIDIDDKDGGEVDPTDPKAGGALLGFYIDSTHVHEGSMARVYAYIKNAKSTEDALSVSVSLSSGSLADASDYTLSASGIITIPEGGDTSFVDLSAAADSTVEGNEWLRLVATAVNPKDSINASEAIDSVVIVDIDDTDGGEIDPIDPIDPDKGGGGGALLSFHIVEDTIQEDGGVAQLIVALNDDKTTQNEIKVTLLVADSLSSGSLTTSDYSVVTTITIPAGAKEQSATFTGLTDNLIEGFETAVILATSNNTKDSIWIDSYKDSVVIKDADANEFGGASLTLSVVPNTIAEDSNDSLAVVVSLADATKTVETDMGFTLNYPLNIDGVNGLEPEDYRLGTAMEIKARTNSDTLWFVPVNDELLEGIETMGIKVQDSSAINTWVNDSVSVTITDDDYDGTAMAITLSLDKDSVKEGESAILTATIEGGLTYTDDLVVDLSQHISSSSKLNATDYDMPATITILASTNSASVIVAALKDSVYEGFDTLNIKGSVSNTMFAVVPTDTLPLVIIDIDDKDGGEVDPTDPNAGGALLGFYIDSTHVHEGSMARVYAYIKNAKYTEDALSVNVSLQTGSLADASDYTLSAGGIITIPEGGDTSYVDLSALADSTVEGNEWLRLVATAVNPKDSINASEAIDSLVIVDIDDTDGGGIDPIDPIDPDQGGGGALLSFHIEPDTINEDGGVAQLIVSLNDDKTTQNEITVTLLVADSLSSASLTSSDYSVVTTITIPAGAKEGSTTFTGITDNLIEGFETAGIIAIKENIKDSIWIERKMDAVVIQDADTDPNVNQVTLTLNQEHIKEGESAFLTASLPEGRLYLEDLIIDLNRHNSSSSKLSAADYNLPATVTILANQSSASVAVVANVDGIYEGFDTLNIKGSVSNTMFSVIPADTLPLVIIDIDDKDGGEVDPIDPNTGGALLGFYMDSTQLHEGSKAKVYAYIKNASSTEVPLSVKVSLQTASMADASDYQLSEEIITIPAGGDTASVTLDALVDNSIEGNEWLKLFATAVNPKDSINAPEVSDSLVIVDIDDIDGGEVDPIDPIDPDTGGGALISFEIVEDTLMEGGASQVRVYLNGGKTTQHPIVVQLYENVELSSSDITEEDYSMVHEVTIPAGGSEGVTTLKALNDEAYDEVPELLVLGAQKTSAKDSIWVERNQDSVYILNDERGGRDDDYLIQLVLQDSAIQEGRSTVLYAILASEKPAATNIVIGLNVTKNSKVTTEDYIMPMEVVIPAGSVFGAVNITARVDYEKEDSELLEIQGILDAAPYALLPPDLLPLVIMDANDGGDSSRVSAFELKSMVHAIPMELCDTVICDLDMPYVATYQMGLDREKNHLEVTLDLDQSLRDSISFASVSFSGVDENLYTSSVAADGKVMFNDGQATFNVKHQELSNTSDETLLINIHVGGEVQQLKVLFSEDFDQDGISNFISRSMCIKTTEGIFNEWYFHDLNGDADGDGIPNQVEVGGDINHLVDTDGDCIPDVLDTDSDGDGVPDEVEKFTERETDDADGKIRVHPAISANADGLGNDKLYIENIEKYPNNSVTIFSRTGKILYKTTRYNNVDRAFDGYPNQGSSSKRVQLGTYYYYIEYTDPLTSVKQYESGFIEVRY